MNPIDIKLYRPPSNSHKGQNGKLLVIGGSELFHSSIFWSADVASKIVDLVHLTSPANENNQIFRSRLKEKFWNGIVVDWKDVESYIEEDDCVLIGPGMIREGDTNDTNKHANDTNNSLHSHEFVDSHRYQQLNTWAKSDMTKEIVNYLLKKYSTKKWVIDGGALQEVDLGLITESCILTPHKKEFEGLTKMVIKRPGLASQGRALSEVCANLSCLLGNCTILLKGQMDIVCQGNKCMEIKGGPPSLANRLQELFVHGSWRATRRAGNPGMTKGGTGDVLAGLAAALYTKNDSWTAATIGSRVNKKSGDQLYKKVGPYFNAADLVAEVPKVLAKFAKPVASREVSQTSQEV